MKKFMSISLSLICAISIIGCTPTESKVETPEGETTKTTDGTKTEETKTEENADVFEFSYAAPIWAPFDANQTEIFDEIGKRTNTKVDFQWIPAADFDKRLSTILASGDLPDVLGGGSTGVLLDQGAIIPLDESLEAYGPNILSKIGKEQYPNWREVSDNKIYNIPTLIDIPGSKSNMIRKDWLEKVGLEVPTNWEEWVTVWEAFRDNDVNESGTSGDVVPFSFGTVNLPLLQAFGMQVSLDGLFSVNDGKYNFIAEDPNYANYLETMIKLYSDKIIDQQYVTRTQDEVFKIMDNGTLGSVTTWAERSSLSSKALQEVNPEAQWISIPPITGPNGDQNLDARPFISPKSMLTIQAEADGKIEGIMKYYDYMFTDDGISLSNYGIEGTHFDMVEGVPVLKEPYINGFVDARKAGLIPATVPFYWQPENYAQILLNGKTFDELDDNTKAFYNGLYKNDEYFYYPTPTFKTKAYQKNSATVITKFEELQDLAITGTISLEEFYSKYEALKGEGLQDIITEASEAYEVINSSN